MRPHDDQQEAEYIYRSDPCHFTSPTFVIELGGRQVANTGKWAAVRAISIDISLAESIGELRGTTGKSLNTLPHHPVRADP